MISQTCSPYSLKLTLQNPVCSLKCFVSSKIKIQLFWRHFLKKKFFWLKLFFVKTLTNNRLLKLNFLGIQLVQFNLLCTENAGKVSPIVRPLNFLKFFLFRHERVQNLLQFNNQLFQGQMKISGASTFAQLAFKPIKISIKLKNQKIQKRTFWRFRSIVR